MEELKMQNEQNKDKSIIYRIKADAYKVKYKLRYKLFEKLLKHMENKTGTDCCIFMLMEAIKFNQH